MICDFYHSTNKLYVSTLHNTQIIQAFWRVWNRVPLWFIKFTLWCFNQFFGPLYLLQISITVVPCLWYMRCVSFYSTRFLLWVTLTHTGRRQMAQGSPAPELRHESAFRGRNYSRSLSECVYLGENLVG